MKNSKTILLFLALSGVASFAFANESNLPTVFEKNVYSNVYSFDSEDDWEIISPSDYEATIYESTFGKDDFVIKNTGDSTWLEVVAVISPDDNAGHEFRLRSTSTTRPGEEIKWKSVYNFHGKLGQIILVGRVR